MDNTTRKINNIIGDITNKDTDVGEFCRLVFNMATLGDQICSKDNIPDNVKKFVLGIGEAINTSLEVYVKAHTPASNLLDGELAKQLVMKGYSVCLPNADSETYFKLVGSEIHICEGLSKEEPLTRQEINKVFSYNGWKIV